MVWIKVTGRIQFLIAKVKNVKNLLFLTYLFWGMACESTSLSCRQCGKKSFWALTQFQQEQSRVKKGFSFISDISDVSYNIWLTKIGQLATFLYSRLAHKEATGNSAYFFEYKPHLTNIHSKVACPSKEQVHEERVEVVIFQFVDQILDKCRPNI